MEHNKKKSELFMIRLFDLLEEFNAEIQADDHWTGYAECGKDIRMTVSFTDMYDEVDLGCWVDKLGSAKYKKMDTTLSVQMLDFAGDLMCGN